MHNIINNSTEGILNGITRVTDTIRKTYGGAGTNVIVESKLTPRHLITNDCDTIIQAMYFRDKAEDKGLDFLKELSAKQDKIAGNGRKTTVLMGETLLKEGFKAKNPNKLKKELDSLIKVVENEIDARTEKITLDDVKRVATTASESEETGSLLHEIYQQIGNNGILNIEGSKTYETSYQLTNGIRFEMTGMLSPEMVHDEEAVKDKRKETKAVYEKPIILVTKKKITTVDDINPLLIEMRNAEKKDLVIFTNDMDSNVASLLVGLHKSKEYNVLVIKAPVLWQNMVFEDFAKCVGATILEDSTGVSFKNLTFNHLGTCGRIEVEGEDTILTGIQDISEYTKMLADKGDNDSLIRLQWLATKSATLKLGSNSHTDLSLKRLKANDANRSTYLALQYGVVKGGGICLSEIADTLGESEAEQILKKALKDPMAQQIKNYELSEEEYKKLITTDIVDSAMVIKRAVRNAVGIASTVLTAPDYVHLPIKTPEEIAYEIAVRQSNPFGQN